jgi:selenocysteine lyase/cysteine desulfurase
MPVFQRLKIAGLPTPLVFVRRRKCAILGSGIPDIGTELSPVSSHQLYHLLNNCRIIATPRLGRLRVSPHFYNTREEIDRLIEALTA